MKKLSLILTLCLSACGGAQHGATPPPPDMGKPMVDAYTQAVGVVVGDSAETGNEPLDVGAYALTEPDDSEPVAT